MRSALSCLEEASQHVADEAALGGDGYGSTGQWIDQARARVQMKAMFMSMRQQG
mgnify:CR=1 FL=1